MIDAMNCKCGKYPNVYQWNKKTWVCCCVNPNCKVPYVTAESREKVIERWNRKLANGGDQK